MKSFLAEQSPRFDEQKARTLPSRDYLKNTPLASVEILSLDAQMAFGTRSRQSTENPVQRMRLLLLPPPEQQTPSLSRCVGKEEWRETLTDRFYNNYPGVLWMGQREVSF